MAQDVAAVELGLLRAAFRTLGAGVMVFDQDERLVLWNAWLERASGLAAGAVLERDFSALFPELCGGRVHQALRTALRQGLSALLSQTLNRSPFALHGADGERMPQAVQVTPLLLQDGQRFCMVHVADVSSQVARENQLRRQAKELEALVHADSLTGVANRRRFDIHLEGEYRRAQRNGTPLSLIMIDVDCFKQYNDNYGHQQGDACLIAIARILASVVARPQDLLARYGGEEFAAILPDTDAEGAAIVARHMHDAVRRLAIAHEYSSVAPRVTLSQGICTVGPGVFSDLTAFVETADRALYRAKAAGRNRSESA
ncbi:sensor domain-containing diguanylate cyclase [Pseudoduganella sp. OTU4001]|uniref:sensor domain-containing diguanylate cyclase n=1 Tax=Pseudoduganella sp. OTU4001 TaxID=3043854 RepID=UPI00313E4B32